MAQKYKKAIEEDREIAHEHGIKTGKTYKNKSQINPWDQNSLAPSSNYLPSKDIYFFLSHGDTFIFLNFCHSTCFFCSPICPNHDPQTTSEDKINVLRNQLWHIGMLICTLLTRKNTHLVLDLFNHSMNKYIYKLSRVFSPSAAL